MPHQLKEITLEVTRRCPLRCLHCSSKSVPPGIDKDSDMPQGAYLRIIREAADMGADTIAISGGEPLLWPHLEESVNLADGLNMQTKLYTSGAADGIDASLRRLRNLSSLAVSLHGATSVTHDRVTGASGSYEAALEALRSAVALGLRTEIHFVPLAINYSEIRGVADLARKLGAERVSVLRFVPQGRGADARNQTLSRQQNLELRDSVLRLREERYDVRMGAPFNEFFPWSERIPCRAGTGRVTVTPDLSVHPCDALKYAPPLGELNVVGPPPNLRSATLCKCWREAERLREVRHSVTESGGSTCIAQMTLSVPSPTQKGKSMKSRKKNNHRALIGRRVTFQLADKSIEGTIVEDRGFLGVGGRQLVRIEFSLGLGAERCSLELPLEKVKFTDEEK